MAEITLEMRRHSAAHLMARAILNLFEEVQIDIGPKTDEGFYYDDDYFYGETLHSWVDSGFLALRYAPAFDDSNIIAEIYQNGTVLQMTGEYAGNYGYCYVPAFDMYGWVDVRFTY